MAKSKPTSTGSASQLTPHEMRGLAARLRARADSVLMKDQPHQAADLRTTAQLLDELAELHTVVHKAVADITEAMARLTKQIGGA